MTFHPNIGILYTYQETAYLLGLRYQTVRAYTSNGKLERTEFLGNVFVTEGEVLRYGVRVMGMDTGVLSGRLRAVREGL